jgi:hypothetical protein
MGAKGDGGLLVPDDLKGIEACFSPGVNFVSEFEFDCLEKNIKVFMAVKYFGFCIFSGVKVFFY